jgi:hypothetical protein
MLVMTAPTVETGTGVSAFHQEEHLHREGVAGGDGDADIPLEGGAIRSGHAASLQRVHACVGAGSGGDEEDESEEPAHVTEFGESIR